MTTENNTPRAQTIQASHAPMEIFRAAEKAKDIILNGGLVAMPTETVYGLAADATNNKAVARIFEAKARPQFNPLIIHVSSIEMAARYVEFCPLAEKLTTAFWPGPLTLVLPRRQDSSLSLLVSAGLDTVGVRMPQHLMAQTLIKAADHPLAAPSANRSGTISPTEASHVTQSLGANVDLILDGGACSVGVESTIVKVDNGEITLLRPGGIDRTAIERVIDKKLRNAEPGTIEAPGMLTSHYAPTTKMRLNATQQNPDEAFLGFGEVAGSQNALNLSEKSNLREAAANLFAYLRNADALCTQHNLRAIAVAPIPPDGLGEAINDRLSRAAAPKE